MFLTLKAKDFAHYIDGRSVHSPSESFRGLAPLSLAFGSEVLASLKSRSGFGAFFLSISFFFFLFLSWETA